MFTPSQIQEKQFKNGLGYDKKDVDLFLQDISSDYTILLMDNDNLGKKLKEADEGLAYYKSIEKTLQKALVLAEKTAQDTISTAQKEAEVIEKEARTKAQQILSETLNQIHVYEHKIINLIQQYDLYKIQFDNLLRAQQELLNSKSFSINTDDYTYQDTSEHHMERGSAVDIYKNLAAITEENENAELHAQEELKQSKFEIQNEDTQKHNYRTEDGFEFFTMKDE
jgi:cell division initiation protein